MKQFGNMLRQERKDRGLTLGDLARGMGLSVPYLSQIETGTKPPVQSVVDKAARYFGLFGEQANALARAAALACSEFSIRLNDDATDNDRILASSLASGFARLTPEKKEELRRIMEDANRG